MTEHFNEDLLEAARAGDLKALDRLPVACRPDLRRYATRHCEHSSDIDDAVQEVSIILYRRLPGLRSLGAFTSWLVTIVRRECQRLSRRMFHLDVPLDEAAERHHLQTLTVGEIAKRLDMIPATVKTRIHRERQLVREHLLV